MPERRVQATRGTADLAQKLLTWGGKRRKKGKTPRGVSIKEHNRQNGLSKFCFFSDCRTEDLAELLGIFIRKAIVFSSPVRMIAAPFGYRRPVHLMRCGCPRPASPVIPIQSGRWHTVEITP